MYEETTEKVLYSEEQIRKRVRELAAQIAKDYQEKPLVIIGVLKGSFMLVADLLRALYEKGLSDVTVDFMTVASYGSSTESSRSPRITHDSTIAITDKNVLLVDDIFDTGHTLKFTQDTLLAKRPTSLKTLVLLTKPSRKEVEVSVDYIGFELQGSPWVEGYGLDSSEFGRGRPEIVEKVTNIT